MSTYKGVVKTAVDAGGVANKLGQGLIDGRVKVMLDSYTVVTSSEPASGSLLKLGSAIPTGANIIAIALSASVAQTSLTVNIGDIDSATRYASAHTGLQTAIGGASNSIVLVSGANRVVGTSTYDNQLVLVTGGATMTAGVIYVAIFYTVD
jgi:hypothetical protein